MKTFVAIFSFHLAYYAFCVYSGGILMAPNFFPIVAHVVAFNVLKSFPVLLIPTCLVILALLWFAKSLPFASIGSAAVTGIIPFVLFLLLAEVTSAAAMQAARWRVNGPTCFFGVQSFTASARDKLGSLNIKENAPHSQHHAHLLTEDGRLLIWSYRELAFVPSPDHQNRHQQVPTRCLTWVSAAQG